MQLADFTYNLPEELIAKYPAKTRTDSRLMVTSQSSADIKHDNFKNIIDFLNPGDLLILNNTKVLPARFFGTKPTGGKLEFLLERVLSDTTALVYIKANRAPKPNTRVYLDSNISITITSKQDNLYVITLEHSNISWETLLNLIGDIPLPPYINRKINPEDLERYQTVYAQHNGAVAAPTAGLHFDQELLATIKDKGVDINHITLHVGSGTFAPVRVQNIQDHKMHSERYSIDTSVVDKIIDIKKNKKNNKIIAVGTTSLRCLETVFREIDYQDNTQDILGNLKLMGDTDIFIYPGFKFNVVDKLITNFHLPGSTLMMLISAFAGTENIKHIYQTAIEHKYRFYSYGDAMLLSCQQGKVE